MSITFSKYQIKSHFPEIGYTLCAMNITEVKPKSVIFIFWGLLVAALSNTFDLKLTEQRIERNTRFNLLNSDDLKF